MKWELYCFDLLSSSCVFFLPMKLMSNFLLLNILWICFRSSTFSEVYAVISKYGWGSEGKEGETGYPRTGSWQTVHLGFEPVFSDYRNQPCQWLKNKWRNVIGYCKVLDMCGSLINSVLLPYLPGLILHLEPTLGDSMWVQEPTLGDSMWD